MKEEVAVISTLPHIFLECWSRLFSKLLTADIAGLHLCAWGLPKERKLHTARAASSLQRKQNALQDQSCPASDLVQYLLDTDKISHQEWTTRENKDKEGTQFQKALVYF